MSYCGDHLEDFGIVYLQGPGKMANMDIDCDGEQGGPQDGGRCDDTGSTIPETSIRDTIQGYDVGISDLNSHEHSFAVFGNSGSKDDWVTFDPRSVGIEKASLMAVVCDDQMVRSVFDQTSSRRDSRMHRELTFFSSTPFGATQTAITANAPPLVKRPSP